MILYIDFDDTIHDPKNRQPGYKLGIPIKGAKQALWELAGEGNHIVIFCIWANTTASRRAISSWLDHFGFPEPYDVTNIKGDAHYYIDNKAIHFDNWKNVLDQVIPYEFQQEPR